MTTALPQLFWAEMNQGFQWGTMHMPTNSATTITLLMPTLNEIEGLKATLPHIDKSLFDEIVVVDGGSTDGTVEYVKEQGARVVQQTGKGVSNAEMEGIDAIETEFVVLFSPDGNSVVDKLSPLVEKLKDGNDLAVVSRYLPPASSEDDTFITALGNKLFTLMISGLGPFPITDSLVIFRGIRCSIVKDPDFRYYLKGPMLEPLMSGWCNLHRKKMAEIAGDEPARIGGASKMRVLYNGSMILLMVVRLYLKKFFNITV